MAKLVCSICGGSEKVADWYCCGQCDRIVCDACIGFVLNPQNPSNGGWYCLDCIEESEEVV